MRQPTHISFAGCIYKISHPMINGVYIGQTVKSPEERFKEHIREANGYRRSSKGSGALYEVIRAFGSDEFRVEKIAIATSKKELNDLEAYYIKKYNSKQNGLNRVNSPQTEPKIIQRNRIMKINGGKVSYSSIKELCRNLKIPYTSLLYWINKRQVSIEEGVKKVIEGTKKQSEKGFYCFRKLYKTYTELANDKRINCFKLTGKEIATRVRSGLSVEEAVRLPKRSIKSVVLTVNGKKLNYANIAEAFTGLSVKHKLPSYSTIVQRISKGESADEAFGLVERPWKDKFRDLKKYIDRGYKIVGEIKSWSQPVILDVTKEIFACKRDFAETYGLEYTETSKKLKNGIKPVEILQRSGHLPISSIKKSRR